jgi:hypothetical protein
VLGRVVDAEPARLELRELCEIILVGREVRRLAGELCRLGPVRLTRKRPALALSQALQVRQKPGISRGEHLSGDGLQDRLDAKQHRLPHLESNAQIGCPSLFVVENAHPFHDFRAPFEKRLYILEKLI